MNNFYPLQFYQNFKIKSIIKNYIFIFFKICLKKFFNLILLRNITKTSGTSSTTFSITLLYSPKWLKIELFLLTNHESIIRFIILIKFTAKLRIAVFVMYILKILNKTSPSCTESICIIKVPKYIYIKTFNFFILFFKFGFKNILRSSSPKKTAPITFILFKIIFTRNNINKILFSNNFYSVHIRN